MESLTLTLTLFKAKTKLAEDASYIWFEACSRLMVGLMGRRRINLCLCSWHKVHTHKYVV